MRIGLLLPSVAASNAYSKSHIFAPLSLAVILADTLVQKGHEVNVYTSRDVKTIANLIPGDHHLTDDDINFFQLRFREDSEKKYKTYELIKQDFENELTLKAYGDAMNGKLDVIHSYHNFNAHYFNELTKFPTLYTLHDPLPDEKNTIEYLRFSKFANHSYVSISNSQRKGIPKLNFIDTIYHGFDLSEYPFQDKPEDYLVYFGRMIEAKGLDLAIKVAKELDLKLYIATPLSPANTDQDFYINKIKPFIDGKNIKLFGFLKKNELKKLVSNAKAFLFPLRWEEPFGLTVIESMASGTPVVAYANGSMPELIQHGKTGFLVKNEEGIEGLKKAIGNIDQIDRKDCRKHVEENFSKEKMTDRYIEAYIKTIAQSTLS